MVDALVRMRFIVPQLWIGLDVLGARFSLTWGEWSVEIRLPETAEEFSELPDAYSSQYLPSLTQAGPVFAEPDRDVRTAALVLFEVTVETVTNFPFPKPADLSEDLRQVVEADLRAGMDVAQEVAGLFVRHLRAAAPHQTWLGLSAHKPRQYGIAQIEYRDSGERMFGLGPTQSVTMRSSRIRVDLDDVAAIVSEVRAHEEPPITDSLIADAWHLDDAETANDQDRALLVAAIAAEVRTKQVIRDRVSAEKKALADLVLSRRSNLPELLDEVLLATIGVSLRKADADLYGRVKALSEQRNAIVHRGRRNPRLKQPQMPTQAVSSLFEWLDGLPDTSA
ncbi:hypothetical protein ACFQ9V_13235 [Leifsonia sp. NPDC056665]|uniref:hypothetical protein n=1 Tax=Leifsonia sp. NPDC056665 TaxID=3345901 RepID=UPI0036AD661A